MIRFFVMRLNSEYSGLDAGFGVWLGMNAVN